MSDDIEISIEEVLELVSFYRDSEGRVYIMNKLDQLQKDREIRMTMTNKELAEAIEATLKGVAGFGSGHPTYVASLSHLRALHVEQIKRAQRILRLTKRLLK